MLISVYVLQELPENYTLVALVLVAVTWTGQTLQASSFIKNPFSEDEKDRLYKTGDLVKLLDDGNIEFVGRMTTR